MFSILASIVTGYLLGSIPFGFLTARLRGIDIREHGSRNIGATNVWRVCGWKFGLLVFLLDALKGAGAVWLGGWIAIRLGGDAAWGSIGSAMACIVGHSFPVWLGFKGGKGVATSLGALLCMMPLATGVTFLVWILVFKISRYVSLASIVAAVVLPAFAIAAQFTGRGRGWPFAGFATLAGLLVILRHRANIQRLLAGTENRFGKKKEAQA